MNAMMDDLPIPIWRVDARASADAAMALRSKGVIDIKSYIDEHPELVEKIFDLVCVEKANRAAAELFGAESNQDMSRPVKYFFTQAPQARNRLLVSRLGDQRSHLDGFPIVRANRELRKVIFHVSFPRFECPEDKAYVVMLDADGTSLQHPGAALLPSGLERPLTSGLVSEFVHEFTQPLSAILTSAETAQAWLQQSPPNLEKAGLQTERIVESANRASELLGMLRKGNRNG